MTVTTRRFCRQLADSCEFATEDAIEKYLAAVEYLRNHPSVAVLDSLLGSLRDNEGGEVQYELVEACEAYSLEEYIPAFLRHAARLRLVARQWGRLLFQSILNAADARQALVAGIGDATADQASEIAAWAREIATEDPKYRAVVRQLGQR